MTDLMKKLLWLALVGLAVTLSAPTAAQAQFQSGFVGWTNMTETETADGLINFAVYRPSVGDSNWTDDFGTAIGAQIFAVPGSGTLDTNTFEVLFFQMVNTDPPVPDGNINRVLISDPLGLITSVGYIDGRVFKDLSGNVGPSGNRVIGSETDPAPTATPSFDDSLDGVPTRSDRVSDLASTPFGTEVTAVNPSTADTSGGFRRFNWTFPGIPDLGFSSVFFVTTDHGPSTYREGRLGNSDSGAFSNGDIPSPNPEPGPLVLVLVGVLGYAGYSLKKAKQATADAELQTAQVAI